MSIQTKDNWNVMTTDNKIGEFLFIPKHSINNSNIGLQNSIFEIKNIQLIANLFNIYLSGPNEKKEEYN